MGADLSFPYGYFLGVSINAEAVYLSAVTDHAYAEIQALAAQDSRWVGMAPMRAGDVIRTVVGRLFDGDSAGSPFIFTGGMPCPRCAAAETQFVRATDIPWPTEIFEATHARWDALSDQERIAEARIALDEALAY